MYPYLKHQTELFRFDNTLAENTNVDTDTFSLLNWKIDFSKSQDNTLMFAVLGMYKIATYGYDNNESQRLYTLNAGRVFEIGLFDSKDSTSFEILEECFNMVYDDLNRIAKEVLRNTSLSRFSFPVTDIEAFHANLHLRFARLDY